jgi:tripartite-type tricarboxylate transporter receptor subunit TctC
VSITESRKSKARTPPLASKSRRTQRRPLDAVMLHGHPSRVNAANLPRRQFLRLAAGTAALSGVSRIAGAQTYPTRPARIIAGFGPGGPSDIFARLIGQSLSERLGQPFIIENRPGAGTNIATEAVVRASPDGYTLLMIGSVNTYNVSLYDRLNFNFIRDIAPVATMAQTYNVMEVHPSFPAKTVPEFIAYAKANPGRINMAVVSGGATHLYGELFKAMAGVDIVSVYYRGPAPALTDLLAGQVDVMFDSSVSSIEHIRTGKLRALAVTSATSQDLLPDIPALGEFVVGYEASYWYGLGAPRNTPAEIIDRLNREINAALADPKMKSRLAELGGTVFLSSPADLGKLIARDTEKRGKVIRAANIKAE